MYDGNYLGERLRKVSVGRDNAPFLHVSETGETLTYGAFFANAEKMAALLCGLGVMPGDRIAVQTPKTPAMLELYVGAVLAGAVFLPLNNAYTGGVITESW